MKPYILITGASGRVGQYLVQNIAMKGAGVRAGIRPGEVHRIRFSDVEIAEFDFEDLGAIDRALDGIKILFLITPIAREQVEYARRTIDSAVCYGVELIITISIMGSDLEPGTQITRWHRRIERYLENCGVAYTILRPNMYMQNFLRFMQPSGGFLFLPLNDAMVSYVDVRDIAAVAAAIISNEEKFINQVYEITGPAALSIEHVAENITRVSGHHVGYIPLQEETAFHVMESLGFPVWIVKVLLELYAQQRMGYNERVSNAVTEILGRKPLPFEVFALDHSELFKCIIEHTQYTRYC
ncbi:MAG TPA: NmrA family NAD(P)-binding protein [Chitinispirillaceae bacterium]|nr:NmrA family NAD(P)-binding protein [Chitinispirillaceae bacterium]